MNNEQMQAFAAENLAVALESLKDVQGVRTVKNILDVLENVRFLGEATIIDNRRFRLTFDIKSNKLEFATTYSNQEINQAYMNEMMLISQKKDLIEFYVESLLKLIQQQ